MKNTRNALRRSRLGTLAILMTFVAFLSSCKKDDDNPSAQADSIADLIVARTNLSILEAAITKAGMLDAYKQPNLTVFAPSDSAFQAAGITDANALAAFTADQLRAMLQYSALAAPTLSSAIPTESNKAVQTSYSINGARLNAYLTKNNSGIYYNGAKVVQADIQGSNGVMHIINRIVMPPTGDGTLVGVVAGNPNLSLLRIAALKVAASDPTLQAALTGSATAFTIFAPTNSAFQALGYDSTKIAATPVASLSALLANHIVTDRRFVTDLPATVTALSGKPLTITTAGDSTTVKSAGIATAARVTGANYAASNGVIHVVNKVLLP